MTLFLLVGCAHEIPSFPVTPPADIQLVNNRYNDIPYVSDPEGTDDWKQPFRFLMEGGDCEDYAIAKYYGLHGNHHVAILGGYIMAIDINGNSVEGYHAVLLVDKYWVLDNNFDTIFPLAEYIQNFKFMIIEITDNRRVPKLFMHLQTVPPK